MIFGKRVHDEQAWLAAFHAGDRTVIESCYRDHFARVAAAAAQLLRGVDAETVTHEVFFRLLTDRSMRESFQGGNLGAWLTVVAKRAAIDSLRRLRREESPSDDELEDMTGDDAGRVSDEADARMLVERFRRDVLPGKWQMLFELRFLRHLPQREVARELGLQRTTLVYQEQRVRELLERFLLGEGNS